MHYETGSDADPPKRCACIGDAVRIPGVDHDSDGDPVRPLAILGRPTPQARALASFDDDAEDETP